MEPSPRTEGRSPAPSVHLLEVSPLTVGYRRAIVERVLTTADLNRALLARQFLLERSRLPLTRTLDRIAGIQAQYAPSSYIGLWSRLEGFQLADLTRALERRKVVQGTLLRSTIHLVSAGDYWPFAVGTRAARQEAWLRFDKKRLSRSDLTSAAKAVRSSLSGKVLHRDELLELARKRDPERPTHLWNGLAAWIDLVRAPPSGTWERRRADLYALADEWLEPPTVTPKESVMILLRRYLTGFGPARVTDAANWAGLAASDVQQAADGLRLRRFRDEEGRELVDLPRAPLPGGANRAPARFLPTWDATLLVHARGTQILPERFRPLVFDTKTPHSTPTFLVDGAVAGKWSVEATKKKATLLLEPFERMPAPAKRQLRVEAERLVRFVEPDATSHTVRGG